MRLTTPPPPGSEPPVIDLVDGAVRRGERTVLRHVNLRIDHGEFVTLLGANGAGKSTLVRALTGLTPLSEGQLSLFGIPQHDFHDWSLVGYVPQRSGAGTGVPASVREVVATGRVSRRRIFWPLSRHDRECIDRAIEVVGLSDRAGSPISALSGGQQQRVLIARALASEPSLLFLDEPTAGVDLHNQQVLAEVLHRLSDAGTTIVLVAHELGPLAPLVQRVVVMKDQGIGYDGPPPEDFAEHDDPGGGHHHHDPRRHGDGHLHVADGSHDHAPHVASPLDTGHRHHEGHR